jgi:lipoprotein-anchoring transpeptidase ErfK/SrfK
VRRLLLVLVLALAGAVAAPAGADDGTVVPDGVVLGGIPIGGLTSDAATALVQQRFSRPVVLRVGQTKAIVTPASLGVTIWADTAVAKALTVEPGTTLGFRALFSRARVAAYVAQLARRFDRTARASRLLLKNSRPLFIPSRTGLEIERGATVGLLSDELAHGTRAPIVVPAKRLMPQGSTAAGSVVVIRRSSNLLTLYRGDRYVRRFHVATGQSAYPTPLGRFQIVVKWRNPTWYPPTQDAWAKGLKPVPPGPANPLGTRWMGLSSPGVGIHGTDEPASIGYSLSHGCIRMLVPDAEWLFEHVTVGTPVFIVAS